MFLIDGKILKYLQDNGHLPSREKIWIRPLSLEAVRTVYPANSIPVSQTIDCVTGRKGGFPFKRLPLEFFSFVLFFFLTGCSAYYLSYSSRPFFSFSIFNLPSFHFLARSTFLFFLFFFLFPGVKGSYVHEFIVEGMEANWHCVSGEEKKITTSKQPHIFHLKPSQKPSRVFVGGLSHPR